MLDTIPTIPPSGRIRVWCWTLVLIASCATANPDRGSTSDGGTDASPDTNPSSFSNNGRAARVSPPFDIGAVMQQVHFAFRPMPGGWGGGHRTYSVTATVDALSVIPYHQVQGQDDPTVAGPLVAGTVTTFTLFSIERDGVNVSAGDRWGRIESNGHLVISYGTVQQSLTEHLRNTEHGIEQSYRFQRFPVGRGDLRIRLRVHGAPCVGETASGVHLVDPSTGLGLRYRHPVWVDGHGVRTSISARCADGTIDLRVPAAVIDTSILPTALETIIEPESGIDTPVWPGPAPGQKSHPALAFDPDHGNYLLVWEEYSSSHTTDIYAARVSATGVVRDPSGFAVSSAPGSQRRPAVAFNGTDFLVVWEDDRRGRGVDIYAARISRLGVLRDPSGLVVSAAPGDQREPAVASDGRDYLVVWRDARNGSTTDTDIYAARVTASGRLLDPDGNPLCTAVHSQGAPSVAFDGIRHLVVWEDARRGTSLDIYGARIDPGTGLVFPTDVGGFSVAVAPGDQRTPSVACSRTQCLVAFIGDRGGDGDLFASRVTAAGTVLDRDGLAIATGAGAPAAPAVASDGSGFLVTWLDIGDDNETRIRAARVEHNGDVLLENSAVQSVASDFVRWLGTAAAFGGTDFLVVWNDQRQGASYIAGLRMETGTSSAPTSVDGRMFSLARSVVRPVVASDGTTYLLVWADLRARTDYDLLGVRVSMGGSVLDPSGIVITDAPGDQLAPAVASNGTEYLVVWQDMRRDERDPDIRGARLTASGTVRDPSGIAIAVAPGVQQAPAVTSDGRGYLVVWQDCRTMDNGNYDVYGAHVDPQGDVREHGGRGISTAPGDQLVPTVGSDGSEYLVLWQDSRNGTDFDVYGARVGSTGVLDRDGFAMVVAPGDQLAPTVASDGAGYFVAWSDLRSGVGSDVYGTRMVTPGIRPANVVLAGGAGDQVQPAVAFDGIRFLLVWTDVRNSPSFELYGTRIDGTGARVEPWDVMVSSGAYVQSPRLSSNGAGQFFILYQNLPFDDRLRPWYAESARFFGGPAGTPCVSGDTCDSGLCIDGVCCNTFCGGGDLTDCQACSVRAGAAIDGVCGPVSMGTVCREGRSACDPAEVCDGRSLACPSDRVFAAGTPCSDGNPCSWMDTCDDRGECRGVPVVCASSVTCSPVTCCNGFGSCDDGNPCTEDVCRPEGGCDHHPVVGGGCLGGS